MAFVKNKLRTSMTNKQLTSESLLNIKSEMLRQIDYEDVITQFAEAKSRKRLV